MSAFSGESLVNLLLLMHMVFDLLVSRLQVSGAAHLRRRNRLILEDGRQHLLNTLLQVYLLLIGREILVAVIASVLTSQLAILVIVNIGLLLLIGLLSNLLLVLLLRLFLSDDIGLSLLLRHHMLHLKELVVHVDLLLLVARLLLQAKVLLIVELLHGLLMLVHLIVVWARKLTEKLL